MQNTPKKIKFLPLDFEVVVKKEMSVLDVALNNRIHIDNSCGGSGSCGTCRVLISDNSAKPSPRTEVEVEMAKARSFSDKERLACQLEPENGLVIEIYGAN